MPKQGDMLTRLIAGGALLMLLIAPTQFSFELAPRAYVSPVDPLAWLVFLLWGCRLLRSRGGRRLDLPLFTLLFLGACLLSVFRASSRVSACKDLVQFGEYFVAAFLVLRTGLRDRAFRRGALAVVLAAASIVIAIAAIQYGRAGADVLSIGGTFGNRNVLGGYMALVLPLLFALLLHKRNVLWRVWLGLALLVGGGVTLAGGAVLGIALACGFIAALTSRRALIVTAVVAAAWFGVVLPRLPANNQEVLYQSIALCDDEGMLNPRYPEWQAAAVMALDRPWLGVGLGNYQLNIGGYYGMIPKTAIASEPDIQNLYLVLASSIGLAGLLCFVGMLLECGARALRVALCADRERATLALGACGSLLAFSIACVWSPLLVRGIGIPFAFVLALACALADSEDSVAPAPTFEADNPKPE